MFARPWYVTVGELWLAITVIGGLYLRPRYMRERCNTGNPVYDE